MRVDVEEGGIVLDAVVTGEVPEGDPAELAEEEPATKSDKDGQERRQLISFLECAEDGVRADLPPVPWSICGDRSDVGSMCASVCDLQETVVCESVQGGAGRPFVIGLRRAKGMVVSSDGADSSSV